MLSEGRYDCKVARTQDLLLLSAFRYHSTFATETVDNGILYSVMMDGGGGVRFCNHDCWLLSWRETTDKCREGIPEAHMLALLTTAPIRAIPSVWPVLLSNSEALVTSTGAAIVVLLLEEPLAGQARQA